MEAVAQDWAARYRTDQAAALLEAVNLVVAASGCQRQLTAEQIVEEDDDRVNETLDQLCAGFEDAPVAWRRDFAAMQAQYAEFWGRAVQAQLSGASLYDGVFLETLQVWITMLSSSKVRPFRVAATVAGLSLVEALITVATECSASLEAAEGSVASARRRSAAVPAHLERTIRSLTANVAVLEEHMTSLFQGVFQHRYRDQAPEIRSLCAAALGRWMTDHPSMFLEDQYLKYIGWLLSDKDGDVRAQCARVLTALYSDDSLAPKLRTFTERFSPRMLEGINDVKPHAAAAFVELCGALVQRGLLSDAQADLVGLRVCDAAPEVAAAAAAVVAARCAAEAPQARAQLASLAQAVIRMQALRPGEVDNAAACVAELCAPELPVLGDLAGMVAALETQELDRDEAAAVTGFLLEGYSALSARAGQLRAAKDKERLRAATDALVGALPALLRAYATEPRTVAALADLAGLLDPKVFAASRAGAALSDLASALVEAFLRTSDREHMDSIAATLGELAFGPAEHAGQRDMQRACDQLVHDIVAGLSDAATSADVDEDQAANVLVYAGRLDAVAGVMGPSVARAKAEETPLAVLSNQADLDADDRDAELCAVLCSAVLKVDFALMAELNPAQPAPAALKRIRALLDPLLRFARGLSQHRVTLDLAVLHSRNMAHTKLNNVALVEDDIDWDALLEEVAAAKDPELDRALASAVVHGAAPRRLAVETILLAGPAFAKDWAKVRAQQQATAHTLEIRALQLAKPKAAKDIVKNFILPYYEGGKNNAGRRAILAQLDNDKNLKEALQPLREIN